MVLSIDWGSVPEWLAGAGALVALLFAWSAVRAARATSQQHAAQIDALERAEAVRDEERRSRYASRFVCWITLDGKADRHPAIGVINSNEVPLYHVNIYAGTSLGATFARYNVVGPSSGRRILGRPTRAMQNVLPVCDAGTLLDSGDLWVAMTFRDPAGNWWCRSPTGLLLSADSERDANEICRQEMWSM